MVLPNRAARIHEVFTALPHHRSDSLAASHHALFDNNTPHHMERESHKRPTRKPSRTPSRLCGETSRRHHPRRINPKWGRSYLTELCRILKIIIEDTLGRYERSLARLSHFLLRYLQ